MEPGSGVLLSLKVVANVDASFENDGWAVGWSSSMFPFASSLLVSFRLCWVEVGAS